MADEPNDPWAYGVAAGDADPPSELVDVEPEADDTARHHTGRWTSPSLGAYDPGAEHEALGTGNGADDAYFRDFGYGEGFGDGRLAAGYDEARPDGSVANGSPDQSVEPSFGTPSPAGGLDEAIDPMPIEPTQTNGFGAPPIEPDPAGGPVGPDPGERFAGRSYDPPLGSGSGATPRPGFGGNASFDPTAADDLDDDVDPDEPDSDAMSRRNAIEWVVVLVGAVLLALVLRYLVVQAFWIPSPSMESTLLVRDRVLVNKVSYRIGDISRGDVIVFRRTDEEIALNPELPRDVIKRVIALGGETIEIIDNEVFIDGLLLREPYLDPGVTTTNFGPETVPEDHVFVMGDNRELSLDSRFETGPVSEDRVVGRAFALFWPISRIGSL